MASNDTLILLTPGDNEPPLVTVSSPALLDTRNQHLLLDYDGGSLDNVGVFKRIMPKAYDSGGVKIFIHYTMSSAVTGSVLWAVAFERLQDAVSSISIDSWGSYRTCWQTCTTPATAAIIRTASIAFSDGSQMDSWTAGEAGRIKITRRASVTASDTAAGDAEFWAAEIREQ